MRNLAWAPALMLLAAVATAQDITGIWKLNLEKSKIQNKTIAAETIAIEQTGLSTYKNSLQVTWKSGTVTLQIRNRIFDGQEHPSRGMGFPAGESETCTIEGDGSRHVVQKVEGKVVLEYRSTVSPDGRTMTNLRKSAMGEDVFVFEKQ